MAEKEGFEPSIPFWGIHDFQSCALGQLRDFSISAVWSAKLYYSIVFHLSSPIFEFSHFLNWTKQLTSSLKIDIMTKLYASVAQSVVHLTRNEKVACSSQVTSSKKADPKKGQLFFTLRDHRDT